MPVRPLFQVLMQTAVDVTSARQGWLLAANGNMLEVVAAAGEGAHSEIGKSVLADGHAAYVIASGQPLAVTPDPALSSEQDLQGPARAASVLCVPCGDDDRIVGALELVDKQGGGAFSFSDLEIATILAPIAGAALMENRKVVSQPPSPAELGRQLVQLAESDPARYAAVADMIEAFHAGHA